MSITVLETTNEMSHRSGLLSAAPCIALAILAAVNPLVSFSADAPVSYGCLSPTALAATEDGQVVFISCGTASCVLRFDVAEKKVSDCIPVPQSPSGLVLSPDERQLIVTCAAPESKICIVDVATREIRATIPAGHTAMAPVLSPDGNTLYVCNRFNHSISVVDLAVRKEVDEISVPREPVSAAVTKNGKHLLVANHLPGKGVKPLSFAFLLT